MDLYQLMGILKQMGAMDILLPFLLFYAIFLGILTTKAGDVLGTKVALKQIMAFTLSMIIVAYTPFGYLMGDYLTMIFGGSSTVIVGLLVLILLAGMLGLKMSDLTGGNEVLVLGSVMGFVALIWFMIGPLDVGFNFNNLIYLQIFETIVVIVFFMSRDGLTAEQRKAKKLEDDAKRNKVPVDGDIPPV
ncbi:MAG: hypothetical protein K0B02_05030 [DPANN group archaeon]|nr:hypothetical protein [DPANN group archaeon]